MFALVLKAAFLLVMVFAAFAWFGWNIASLGVNKRESEKNEESDGSLAYENDLTAKLILDRTLKISAIASMTQEQLMLAIKNARTPEKPALLPRPLGQVDDLKIISGIGPVNEKELNALGVYYLWQIAEWTPENIIWVSEHIRFSTRIVRENWIAQAAEILSKKLAISH